MKKIIFALTGLLLMTVSAFAAPAEPETVTLNMVAYKDGSHEFYHELLTRAVEAEGNRCWIISRQSTSLPKLTHLMQEGVISVHWFVESPEHNQELLGVPVPISDNIVGNRILLAPRAELERFAGIQSLRDLQDSGLIAATVRGDYDSEVWRSNGLPFVEHDDRDAVFARLASGTSGVHYMVVGMHEAAAVAELHPELAVEPRLILAYDRDYRFYLGRSGVKYRAIIENALKAARSTGLVRELVRKYRGDELEKLSADSRRFIRLRSPEAR